MVKQAVIHARISEETQSEIALLKRELKLSHVSSVITFAIHKLAQETSNTNTISPFDMIEEMGLIGSIEEAPNLSRDYKKQLSSSLRSKHFKKKKDV